MKKTIAVLVLSAVALFSGCDSYQQRRTNSSSLPNRSAIGQFRYFNIHHHTVHKIAPNTYHFMHHSAGPHRGRWRGSSSMGRSMIRTYPIVPLRKHSHHEQFETWYQNGKMKKFYVPIPFHK